MPQAVHAVRGHSHCRCLTSCWYRPNTGVKRHMVVILLKKGAGSGLPVMS